MPGEQDARRFATEFSEQFAMVAGRALGALNGIEEVARDSASGQEASIDPETAGRLHELYRRRIAPELESAATLASEANSALRRSVDLIGGEDETDDASAPVSSEATHGNGSNGVESGKVEQTPAPEPPYAYRAWSLALEEQRAAATRRRLFRRRRRGHPA
jgi:hypothetical protein